MPAFDAIIIIFNPNSTGSSKEEAQALAYELAQRSVKPEAQLVGTERAGHATEIARDAANKYANPLIVSSSGDGGYHEVVNGIMQASDSGNHPVGAVLPAGNANDHSQTVMTQPLVDAIEKGAAQPIDLIEIRATDHDVRYAHSYVGVGITPNVATLLNKERLNRFNETWLAFKAFRDLQPVVIEHEGRTRRIDSLIVANIAKMAKMLTVAENAEPDDGVLNLVVFPHHDKLRLASLLLKAFVRGIHGKPIRDYDFHTEAPLVMQMDGEVVEIAANADVSIKVARRALRTLR